MVPTLVFVLSLVLAFLLGMLAALCYVSVLLRKLIVNLDAGGAEEKSYEQL